MSYRRLAKRSVLTWAVVCATAKLPTAATPLALVFLVRDRPDGYSLGAALAAVYVLGKIAGAAVLALRFTSHRAHLTAGLLVAATAFAGLALAAPVWLLASLAFLAGAAPAAAPGGLRTMLTAMVDEEDVPRAFSFETVLTEVVWASAPALTVVLALHAGPAAPMVLTTVCAAAAAALMFLLPKTSGAHTERAPVRLVLSAWPIYLTSAAALAMFSTAELALPALLEHRGFAVGWAGPLLTGFSVASGIGAVVYGMRTWPGTVRRQSLVALVLAACCVASMALLPGLPGIATGLALSGLFVAGVMVTRNLLLRDCLPAHAHASAYAVQYAAQGTGYGIAAIVTAAVLARSVPTIAILGGVVVTLTLAGISALAERSLSVNTEAIKQTK